MRFECALVLFHGSHPEADAYLVDALRSRNPLYWIAALGALESKYKNSLGRDPAAWTKFLKEVGGKKEGSVALETLKGRILEPMLDQNQDKVEEQEQGHDRARTMFRTGTRTRIIICKLSLEWISR